MSEVDIGSSLHTDVRDFVGFGLDQLTWMKARFQFLAFMASALLDIEPVSAADEWKPVACESAKPYRGPKLHPPPSRKVFQSAAGSINGDFDADTVARLVKALDQALTATGAPEMTVAVAVPGKGLWTANRASANEKAQTNSRSFWFASVGKAFTAVAVLQLVEARKLSLDDKLARWFPDYPNAKSITIDHLLCHTSGIYSFQNDPALRARRGYRTPEELIEVARAHGNGFCPGEQWSYCNTGYVMLARILEQVEGRPFHEVLTACIINPLGLRNTRALRPREPGSNLAEPHSAKTEEAESEFNLSTPFGAGNIVADAADMVEFWHAVLAGKLLKSETVRDQFQRLYPMFDGGTYYGRGVMLYDVPDGKGERLTWLGHSGGAPGVKAIVAYSVDANAFVAVALNNDGSAEATANLLLKALANP